MVHGGATCRLGQGGSGQDGLSASVGDLVNSRRTICRASRGRSACGFNTGGLEVGRRIQLAWPFRTRPQRARRKTLGTDDFGRRTRLPCRTSGGGRNRRSADRQTAFFRALEKTRTRGLRRPHLRSAASSSMAQSDPRVLTTPSRIKRLRKLSKKTPANSPNHSPEPSSRHKDACSVSRRRPFRTHQRRAKLLGAVALAAYSLQPTGPRICVRLCGRVPRRRRDVFDDFALGSRPAVRLWSHVGRAGMGLASLHGCRPNLRAVLRAARHHWRDGYLRVASALGDPWLSVLWPWLPPWTWWVPLLRRAPPPPRRDRSE